MIDPKTEKLISATEATRDPLMQLPGRKRKVHVSTICRRIVQGVHIPGRPDRIRLEGVRMADGNWYTSREAIKRYMNALNAPAPSQSADVTKPAAKKRIAGPDRARRELAKAGF